MSVHVSCKNTETRDINGLRVLQVLSLILYKIFFSALSKSASLCYVVCNIRRRPEPPLPA